MSEPNNARSSGEVDRKSLSVSEFNDLLNCELQHANPTTHAAIIRDDNDLLIYVGRSRNENGEYETKRYRVVGDGVRFALETIDRADIAAILVENFDGDLITVNERYKNYSPIRDGVPTTVAVDGKPAVAAYLYVQGDSRSEIAELMGVGKPTVNEYLSRFRRRGVGIPDGVKPPEVGAVMDTVPERFDPEPNPQQIVADGGVADAE